jgi:acyl-CoA-binding protein
VWLYEYYGMLKLETWNQLKGKYQDERLKGIIDAKRAELQRACAVC